MMLIALAREILSSVNRHGHKLILAGAGAAATAAFLAHYHLKSAGFELGTGNGQIGYTPIPGESILASEAGVRRSKLLTDTIMMQGVFVGGENNKCLSILGAGQMDKHGNINSTKTSKGKFLVGSGGANDALNAREAIICLDQSKDRFVDNTCLRHRPRPCRDDCCVDYGYFPETESAGRTASCCMLPESSCAKPGRESEGNQKSLRVGAKNGAGR